MSVFVHAQGIKTVHAEWGVKKWQNSVECPLAVLPNGMYTGIPTLIAQTSAHY